MLPQEIEENVYLRKYKRYDESNKLVEVYERDVKSQSEDAVTRFIPRKNPLTEEYETEYHTQYNGDWSAKDIKVESKQHKIESRERAEQKRVDREKRLDDLAKAEALLKELLEKERGINEHDSLDSAVRSGPNHNLMENSENGGEE